jgi:hypothetical protein
MNKIFSWKEFQKKIPTVDGLVFEKQFLPDTAVESAKLYRQLLDIKPRENESPAVIFERVAKAKAAIVKTARVSEINSDILLAGFTLNLVSIRNEDMVNIVYSCKKVYPGAQNKLTVPRHLSWLPGADSNSARF